MRFVKDKKNLNPLNDTVFAIANKAKVAIEKYGKEKVINATVGSLCDEDGALVALDTFYNNFETLNPKIHAKYAQSFSGNEIFKEEVAKWVFKNLNITQPFEVFATPGGTGAISASLANLVNAKETILLPEIAWTSYTIMAEEFDLTVETYSLFENNHFAIKEFKEKINKILKIQDQLLIVINDPCHNPTGYSLSYSEWKELIEFFNTLPSNKKVVILNDIAYIDYSYDDSSKNKYMELFSLLNENICPIIAFSCSKSFTGYGLRLGAAIILSINDKIIKQIYESFEKTARSVWSNVNNGAMEAVSDLLINYQEKYVVEKQKYVNLLHERSKIFIKEADEINLKHYPYKEGFFITLKVDDEILLKYHQALMDANIFTVLVQHGIRIAICSLSIKQCFGLALKMKNILDKLQK